MKTNYIKSSLVLIAILAITSGAKAQQADSAKHRYYADRYNNDDETSRTKDGKKKERIHTNWNNTYYDLTLVNDQVTELYVDGEKIPQAKWGDYSKVISRIREQIRLDKIQAKKDQEQAVRDQAQARLDQQQAVRDQVQAKKDQEQAGRDKEQAKKDQEQASRDQEQAKREQEDSKKDQEQAVRDQAQAKLDQEQAVRDQIQAKKDQEEARIDQQMMKQMVADLISDKIISNEKSLRDLTLNSDEMTVNGIKQPEEVFKKYKEKYKRFSGSEFSYGSSGNSHGIRMSRSSININ